MYLRINIFAISTLVLMFALVQSCSLFSHESAPFIVMYPQHCKGCVEKNLKLAERDKILVVCDTTDPVMYRYIKDLELNISHTPTDSIYLRFGDFANILLVNRVGVKRELTTLEVYPDHL